MSTRSSISIERQDGKIDTIYCHFDGYLTGEGVGVKLLNNYTDPQKVNELIGLGDLSSLGKEIGEKHNFDKAPKTQCNAFHRDRGEDWDDVKPYTYNSLKEFENWQSYNYLFSEADQKWYLLERSGERVFLEEAVAHANDEDDE